MRLDSDATARFTGAGLMLASTLLLGSCTESDGVLFIADRYFDAAETDLEQSLSRELAGTGLQISYSVVESNLSPDRFIEIIAGSQANFVVAPPFMAHFVASAAPVYRDRRFIVIFGDSIAPQENIQRLASDRTAAYHLAGRLSASLLGGGALADGEGGVLVLARTGSASRKRELETLLDGFRSRRGDLGVVIPDPDVREFSDTNDARGAVRAASSSAGRYSLLIVSLGSMNADVLAVVPATEVSVITEGPLVSLPPIDSIVAVIEENWRSALKTAVDSRNPRLVIPSTLVPGRGLERLELLQPLEEL